ncbi:MAG TPA: 3-oxoacyl-ACP reductase family protein [Methylomirabilota bacterium]|nr:3-oxoacyl-ACP reductase family protein [Methylomirabilota bacterium]
MKLEHRVAVVTGAGQGIGRAYAHRLVQEGAKVVVAELNEAKGKAVVEEITAAGGAALFVHTDVAEEASCEEMVASTVRQFGRLDVLVNNAAVFSTITMKPFWELTVAEWDRLMAVNARGVWLASKAVVPQMRRQGGGRIINISSGVIFMGRPNYLHYVASKGAVFAMTRAMARELGDFGITVNTITPGATYTEIPRGTVTPEQREAMLRAMCIKHPEEPKDLVGTVVFLASDDAAFITGQTINVDGGMNFH